MTAELLTPAAAALELHVSERSVLNWCRAGLVPGAVQVGRAWGIPRASLRYIRRPARGRPKTRTHKRRP